MPPAEGGGVVLLPLKVPWVTMQLPMVVEVTVADPPVATDASSNPVSCENPPPIDASVMVPVPGIA
jgi:hypothetical protein